MPIRPRRSILYVPGINKRAIDKCRTLNADGFIFDLEDAVAPAAKPRARDLVVTELNRGGFNGRELFVRINGFDTPWGRDDIRAVARSDADAVLLPKVNVAKTVRKAKKLLDSTKPSGTQRTKTEPLAIWCMLETPKGILNSKKIAREISRTANPTHKSGKSSLREGGLIMGTNDLAAELRMPDTVHRSCLFASLSLCALAARAAGLPIIDGAFLDLLDTNGLEVTCHEARKLGFDGTTLIHPNAIEIANSIFKPSEKELVSARTTVDTFENAIRLGNGIAVVDGKLIENLHTNEARRRLSLIHAIDQLRPVNYANHNC